MGTPDYTSYINEAWGWPDELGFGDYGYFQSANNLVVGGNPPYSASDFLAFFPNFGGIPKALANVESDGSTATLTGITSTSGLAIGQLVAGTYIPAGATIKSLTSNTITLNVVTTIMGTGTVIVYVALLMPLAVINVYVVLASSSLFQQRWGELWAFAMALYVAHLCELWLIGQAAPPGSSAAAVATAGLAIGIKTSKAVQDVSVGITPLVDLEGWGSFQLTIYGQELATYGKTIGSGAMLIW